MLTTDNVANLRTDRYQLVCPACGDDYNHIKGTMAHPRTPRVQDLEDLSVMMYMECENGQHAWRAEVRQVKGWLYPEGEAGWGGYRGRA